MGQLLNAAVGMCTANLSAARFYCETCGMDEVDAVPDCPIFSKGAKVPAAVHRRIAVA